MSFKNRWLSLPVAERESVAQQAGTTRGTLHQVAYAGKRIELGLADCLVALIPGLSLDEIPLTERAHQQSLVRIRAGVDVSESTPTGEVADQATR